MCAHKIAYSHINSLTRHAEQWGSLILTKQIRHLSGTTKLSLAMISACGSSFFLLLCSQSRDGTNWQIEGSFNCHCSCPSLPCFTACWTPADTVKVGKCGTGYKYITLSCSELAQYEKHIFQIKDPLLCFIVVEYVESNASVFGTGSRALCRRDGNGLCVTVTCH